MQEKAFLKLFIAGETSRSRQTVEGIKATFDAFLKEKGTLEIIDILKHPQKAMEYNVLATPTLIRVLPTPVYRVLGDLSDGKKAFDLLGLLKEKP